MTAQVDLSQLAVHRDASPPALPGRRRRVLTRFVLPGLLLAGFVSLIVIAARETLYPPRRVTVVPVILSRSELRATEGTPLFRAAGWVEPRPTPTVITALAEGVLERLLVVEGNDVQAGALVAQLIPTDAKITLEAADAEVQLRDGELAAARAALGAARARLDQPLHLRADLADADAALARAETELGNLPHLLRAAQARQQFARLDWEAKQRAAASVPEASLNRAQSELEATEAAVEELQARHKRLPVEVAVLKEKRDILAQKLALKTEEVRQAAEAEAAVRVAEARLKQTQALRDAARLRLERMEIRAPVSGRVLAVPARPGMRLTGLAVGSLHDSSTVATLYDPAQLQVRVDVRLDDVGKVVPGQKVQIQSAAIPGQALDGEVLQTTSQADMQKNTLAVRVGITRPPSSLRPDMLCQVTFLAPASSSEPAGESDPFRLLVPRQLVEGSGTEARVWVADRLTGTARSQSVQLGLAAGELVEVLAGLAASDKLIVSGRDGLQEGDRITVTGEDETLGLTRRDKPAGSPQK